MWHIFYASITAGLGSGLLFYWIFYYLLATPTPQPRLGLPIAAILGLAIGFGYYLFFKFIVRAVTQPFLKQIDSLISRSIKPLPSPWISSEIDKLEDLLTRTSFTLNRLDQFSAIAKDIIASLDASKTVERIVGIAVETLPADGAILFLFDESRRLYRAEAMDVATLTIDQQKQLLHLATENTADWVRAAEQQRCIIAPNRPGEEIPPRLQQVGVQALISAPLVIGERTIGQLSLFNCSPEHNFSDHDLQLVCTYADLAAIALNNAHRYQEIEKTRNELTAILNGIDNLVIVLDKQENVLHINPAAQQRLCLQAEQVTNQPLETIGLTDLATALEAAQRAKAPVVHEVAGPGSITFQATISPIQSVGWVIVMQDITSLKELDQLRTDWVAGISHDMKNPLTVIQMAAGLFDKTGTLNDRQKDLANQIKQNAQRLRAMIVNVLDLARLKAGPTLRMKSLQPTDILRQALAEVEPLAKDKELQLCHAMPEALPTIQGDAALLLRAMVNLLSNAVKYTPVGRSITLQACTTAQNLQIQVIDTGCGIPAEAIPHLFERFYRVPDSEERSEGSGLGLNIVKSIIDKHQGNIRVDSKIGQGSRFTITLPIEL